MEMKGKGRKGRKRKRMLFENSVKRKSAQEKPPVPPSPTQIKVKTETHKKYTGAFEVFGLLMDLLPFNGIFIF